MKALRIAQRLLLSLAATALLAATASAAPPRAPALAQSPGLLTEIEYSGTWTHTYHGSPDGSALNPGSETITSELKFTESVSLLTPQSALGATGHGANSNDSPVKLTLSGQTTVTYSAKPNLSCSVSFSGRSGLRGADWTSTSPAGHPLAYISVNEQQTKGVVAVYAEAPGLRSSVHPEFVVHHVSGNSDPTGDCGPTNNPRTPVCDDTSLITDPQYTPGDRGFNQPPYGFLHAVAKLDPHTPTSSHPYRITKVLTSCDGTDTVTAESRLIVNNSRANALPPAPKSKLTAEEKWKAAARKVKQPALDDLTWSAGIGASTCGLLVSGIALTTVGAATLDPVAAGSGAIMTSLGAPTTPLCARLAARIHDDLEIVHDPPLRGIHELARVRVGTRGSLPSCALRQGRARTVCVQLRAAASKLVADSLLLSGIDHAIATTVGRGSAAVAKGDKAAIALQLGRLTTLSMEHAPALAAERADTVRVAQVLASAGVDANVTQAKSAAAKVSWLAVLRKHGVAAAAVAKLAARELTPGPGSYVSLLSGGKVAPPQKPPATPAITSVTFAGSAANPTIVVHGANLGKPPAPSPAGHPSGQNGCPVVVGDNGYDYGTSLYIAVASQGWAGGRYRPNTNETDCIDLVVTKFTSTEVDFHFGPFYTSAYPQFALKAGLQATVVVNTASADVTVKYG